MAKQKEVTQKQKTQKTTARSKQKEATRKQKEIIKKQKKAKTLPETILLRQQKRLKYIAVLPTAVTLMNALCGFLAIIYASRGEGVFMRVFPLHKMGISFFAISGYLIFLAMIADVFDGQVARWSGAASAFGGQLDSLSDAISFGVAPAFLMVKVMETRLSLESFMKVFYFPMSLWKTFPSQNAQFAYLAGSWILFIAIFYMLCTVIRLARFNVENDTDLTSHQNFAGLPSPAAAGLVVSLVIFQEDFLSKIAERLPWFSSTLMNITHWLLPLSVLSAGILMVTRIRYTHLANRLLGQKKNFVTVLVVLFVGFLIVWNIQLGLLLGFWGFALNGIIQTICRNIKGLMPAKRVKSSNTGKPQTNPTGG